MENLTSFSGTMTNEKELHLMKPDGVSGIEWGSLIPQQNRCDESLRSRLLRKPDF